MDSIDMHLGPLPEPDVLTDKMLEERNNHYETCEECKASLKARMEKLREALLGPAK